ncbi:hypothetical protein CVT26_006803 [Gymnopilus dilepis]|uniref:Uncharacterized protein n=1 Tax=Gymnopilus dilepis TaxID=231916 RepID=A0A409Y368_9AGAR|nr:hypothetical protein CVT26_006803 [Gymnopilus dilepis]
MEDFFADLGFESPLKFLQIWFYNPSRTTGKVDPRGTTHSTAVARLLQRRTLVKMADVID